MNTCAASRPAEVLVHKAIGICRSKEPMQMNVAGFELTVLPLMNTRNRVIIYVPIDRLESETRPLSHPFAIKQAFRVLGQPRTSRRGGQNWELVVRRFRNKLSFGTLKDLAEVARDTFTVNEWGEVEHSIYSEAVLRMAEEISVVEEISVESASTRVINTIRDKRLRQLLAVAE